MISIDQRRTDQRSYKIWGGGGGGKCLARREPVGVHLIFYPLCSLARWKSRSQRSLLLASFALVCWHRCEVWHLKVWRKKRYIDRVATTVLRPRRRRGCLSGLTQTRKLQWKLAGIAFWARRKKRSTAWYTTRTGRAYRRSCFDSRSGHTMQWITASTAPYCFSCFFPFFPHVSHSLASFFSSVTSVYPR